MNDERHLDLKAALTNYALYALIALGGWQTYLAWIHAWYLIAVTALALIVSLVLFGASMWLKGDVHGMRWTRDLYQR